MKNHEVIKLSEKEKTKLMALGLLTEMKGNVIPRLPPRFAIRRNQSDRKFR